MIRSITLLLSLSILLLNACTTKEPKAGCTDPQATNFDSEAEEESGTCTYISDEYEGNWLVNEAVMQLSQNGSTTYDTTYATQQYQIAIIKTGNFSGTVNNFANNCTYTALNMSATSVVLDSNNPCGLNNIIITRANGQLAISYRRDYSPYSFDLVTATAIKQ